MKKSIHCKNFLSMVVVFLAFLGMTTFAWPTSVNDEFNPGANDLVGTISLQTDGKILVGGSFTSISGQVRNYIARLNADGSVDTGFNPGANNNVFSIVSQRDGKILVGGYFTTIGGQARNYVARLNADGSVDSGFNPGANERVNAITLQTDGKILVSGWFTSIGGQARNYIARLNTDGSVDTGFNPGASERVDSIALQADNKILVGGLFTIIGGQSRIRIARLNADGSVDAGFNPGADNRVGPITVQADNKILVGGLFTTIGGQPRNRIARLNSDGSVDAGFDPGANSDVFSIALQADGKILVGGYFTTIGGQARNYIARLNADGSVDSGFNPGANDLVTCIAFQTDNKILASGWFTSIGGQTRNRIARLYVEGNAETIFNPGANNTIWSIAIQADGKILASGNFTSIGGQARNYFARLTIDGNVDTAFNPGANQPVRSAIAVQADGKILVGGNFSTIGGQTRNRIARLNSDGSVDTGFNPGASHEVYCFAIQPDGKILVGGQFTTIGGQARNYIARLNSDGSVDAGFNPGANNEVYSIVIQPDNKILAGGLFTSIGGQAINYIARLNSDGSVDTGFNPGANNLVWCIAVQTDNKILAGGYFNTIGGQTRHYLARLNSDGSLDAGFSPEPNGAVLSIAMQTDGQILAGGYFSTIIGQARNYIARLNADGSLDAGFNPGADSWVHSIVIQVDGKILAGGSFTSLGGQTRNRIVRLSADEAALQKLVVSADGTAITWSRGQSSPEIHDVTFEYSGDLSAWTPLGSGTRMTGGWALTGQNLPFGVSGYIRGRGQASGGMYNATTSLQESIRRFFNPMTITVTSPNGGESWTGGDNRTITWSSIGSISYVNIDYSINNGSSWNPIASNTDNDGSHSWTVPNTPSTTCLVRVSDAVDNDPIDSSDAMFTILAVETVSTPSTPTGPSAGINNTSYDFSTGGSTSNLGHAVQYKIDWDDGSDSGWLAVGTTHASHSWSSNGTYDVRAMARCASHTSIESIWSDTHSILISDSGSAGYYNSPADRLILTEVNWAPASGGGEWVSEVQITDTTGGSVVQVYYNSGTTRNGPFNLWTNSGGANASVKFSNILSTIDGLDSSAFAYYGTSGALEFITQDASHLLQAAVRTYNGNYSRTFPALAHTGNNIVNISGQLMIPNISNDASYRPSVVLFNPTAGSVTCEVKIIGGTGSQVGSTISRTLAGYEMNVITAEVRADTYSNAFILITPVSGAGFVMASGQTANNVTNDPAAHLAVHVDLGWENSAFNTKYITEVNWAAASGGGNWISEVQITDLSDDSTVQVYYNSGTTRLGPFTLWTNSGGANCSVTFNNILNTIDGLDSGSFVYYGTSGALEFVTQDANHRIQTAVRTYNGNFSRTFPALSDMDANTAASGRTLMIPNISNDATYRPSVVLFNPTTDSVTAEIKIIGSDGIQIGSTITRTVAGYEMNVVTAELRANTYDNAFVRVEVTSGSGRLLVSGQSANNVTNDPAAHIAVQAQ